MNTGQVSSIVGDQVIVKATSNPPAIGTAIYSGKGRIGIVADIIGPVDKPYYVVKPNPDSKIKVGDTLNPG